jgi:hypothetical protein
MASLSYISRRHSLGYLWFQNKGPDITSVNFETICVWCDRPCKIIIQNLASKNKPDGIELYRTITKPQSKHLAQGQTNYSMSICFDRVIWSDLTWFLKWDLCSYGNLTGSRDFTFNFGIDNCLLEVVKAGCLSAFGLKSLFLCELPSFMSLLKMFSKF